MQFITSEAEFESIVSEAEKLVNISTSFPDALLRPGSDKEIFLTFDELRMSLFFNHLQNFLRAIDVSDFIYVVLDPSPDEYGVERIEKFKALKSTLSDTEEDFLNALNEYAGGGRPDCIMDDSNRIFVSTMKYDWCILGDRDSDLAFCYFSTPHLRNSFRKAYGSDILNAETAINYAWPLKSNPELREQFVANYL
ncbi:hypothetical protein ACSV5M_12940 [Cellvibrio sp. ARAG 10.3]|uniref:hypothetical protein n=1 Tax=Cellvibrio sp. ARAG 10.3 TaxID=3451358 RepID=UPI003F48F040